ncbi:hypothetical protein FHS29_001027 [Saccharothrix tamanrassetensis]|uniref:Uncharacterized protein n=2 Tax=Saccharothrix tamanrassetensis TaxID=1051531 RepID=A0A841CE77_9PSEU|nr:hypothetical protein [Saccharothrix tamanrassetensis]
MIGHVVVCRADDGTLAVWHVDTEGLRTAAWVENAEDVFADGEAARRVLLRCRKRGLLVWEPTGAIATLRELEAVAGIPGTDWEARVCAIPDLLAEIERIRAGYQERVAEEQAVKKNVAPLDWQLELPVPPPATPAELQELARFAPLTAPSAAATEALMIGQLCAWVVQRWRETAVVLGRRDYLRAAFGQPTVLPPAWEARLADAFAADAAPKS